MEGGRRKQCFRSVVYRKPAESAAKVHIELAAKPQWIDEQGFLNCTSPIECDDKTVIPKGVKMYERPVGYQKGACHDGHNITQIFVEQLWRSNGVDVRNRLPLRIKMQNKIIEKQLLNEFIKLKLILIREGDNNWIRGVLAIIEKLELSLIHHRDVSVDYCKDACETWKSMYKGNGSFSDYSIWHNDFEQRCKLNESLGSVKERVWNIIKDNDL